MLAGCSAASGTNGEPHPGQQITATPLSSAPSTPQPRILTGYSTATANLDGLSDRQRRRHSYLRERRWRRRHLSVWQTQHIRPLPQCLPSAEQASILMYYTAAVSKETRPRSCDCVTTSTALHHYPPAPLPLTLSISPLQLSLSLSLSGCHRGAGDDEQLNGSSSCQSWKVGGGCFTHSHCGKACNAPIAPCTSPPNSVTYISGSLSKIPKKKLKKKIPSFHLTGCAHLQPPWGQQLTEGPTARLPPVARRSQFQQVRDQSLQCAKAPAGAGCVC